MNVYEAIKKRKSVRNYLDKEVEEEKLNRIMQAVRLAPSASNRQEWRFVIVKDKTMRKKLAKAANNQSFVGEAAVVIVCCAKSDGHKMPCGLECDLIDVAIAIDHLTLAAVEEGLGTCWIGAFSEKEVKNLLGIPDSIRVVELMPLGYPVDDSIKEKSRLSLDEITKYETW